MAERGEKRIFVVDDEVKVLGVIEETLGTLGEVTCFDNPVQCLTRLLSDECDLLIADIKMPEMDGIELLLNVKRHMPWVPVMVVTGYGDIHTAVRAIKAGAEDFIEKPLNKTNLLGMVKNILQEKKLVGTAVGKTLTPIQTEVLKLVIDGKSNREIADELNRSVRTIEVHRSHVMEKLGVKSLIELIKRAISLGLIDLSDNPEPEEV